jgi:large subunit ribosomal protein L9
MQVILLQRIAKLGQMGEVVNVKDGFARNFLLPQGKALRANDSNIKSFESKKSQLEAQNLETKKEAESAAAKIEGQTFVIIRSTRARFTARAPRATRRRLPPRRASP